MVNSNYIDEYKAQNPKIEQKFELSFSIHKLHPWVKTYRKWLPKEESSFHARVIGQLEHYFDTFWIVCKWLWRETFRFPLLLLFQCLAEDDCNMTWIVYLTAEWVVMHGETHSSSPLLCESALPDLLLLLPPLLLLLSLLSVLLLVSTEGYLVRLVLLLS